MKSLKEMWTGKPFEPEPVLSEDRVVFVRCEMQRVLRRDHNRSPKKLARLKHSITGMSRKPDSTRATIKRHSLRTVRGKNEILKYENDCLF